MLCEESGEECRPLAWGTLTRARQRKKEIEKEMECLVEESLHNDEVIAEMEGELEEEEEFRHAVKEEKESDVDKAMASLEESSATFWNQLTKRRRQTVERQTVDSKRIEEHYANKWLEQNGDDAGIPKKYTPCKYFFKTTCRNNKACEFSHNEEIFREEPFADILKNFCWGRKQTVSQRTRRKHHRADERSEEETFARPAPWERKKHRRADEE